MSKLVLKVGETQILHSPNDRRLHISIYRIYLNTRFSKYKRPYKTQIATVLFV